MHKSSTTPTEFADLALLNMRDVCALARVSRTWVEERVAAGQFPQPLRFGVRCLRWRAADVRAWLEEHAPAAHRTSPTATSRRATNHVHHQGA